MKNLQIVWSEERESWSWEDGRPFEGPLSLRYDKELYDAHFWCVVAKATKPHYKPMLYICWDATGKMTEEEAQTMFNLAKARYGA